MRNDLEDLKKVVDQTTMKLTSVLPNSSQVKPLKELEEDMIQDYYTIMVVGEFKHGKSTFVNALLGQDIMPRDVTPTTATINAVFHGSGHDMHIVKQNGEVEKQKVSIEELNKYTASSDFHPEEVKYIKLFLDVPLLKERIILIDTPGVNDLSEQRAEVTHQFLPRADVIIFMSSLTAAIKKSEQEFIENRIKKIGFDRTIFVMNFLDQIDEDELDDVIEFSERRIQGLTGVSSHKVFPVSAKEALQGKLTNDHELIQDSGIEEIEAEIKKRIESSSRKQEKIKRLQARIADIHEVILREIETVEELAESSLEELREQLLKVEDWFGNRSKWEEQLQHYLYEREEEINFLVGKSFQYFGDKVKEDIEHKINLFQGADVKFLVESQIPHTIRSHFNQWIDQYSDHIHQLFVKLEKEVSEGLSRSFQQAVKVQAYRGESLRFKGDIPILNASSGNANVKAGVLVGGVGSLALLLGGPFFLPVVGMAGLPYISQKIAEKQLSTIKPDLIYAVHNQLNVLLDDFKNQLNQYIRKGIDDIKGNALEEFSRLLTSYQMILKQETERNQTEASHIHAHSEIVKELKHYLKELRKEEALS
ncbi:dynamin family protein [Bacillus sp. es.034]|uniref:dynamin family protein n=1 Tax=Bacillus sp. es.034 TaxID=1761763 RepID=UPI000BF6F4E8|nr:dynamin family protein [Bacillus sp. es.034]PFG04550.1 GTPase Era involved in 16S rRNA processing [Bacillus sp. es.034]